MTVQPLLLPPGARLVHIGPHKTGSTAIQVALQEARTDLAAHGVHYATGRRHRPDKAGWALGLKGSPAGSTRPPRERWDELVQQVAEAGEQRVCISNEDFGRATKAQAEEIVTAFEPERVHVVAVARRLDRYLPSQWQERVKAGDRRSFEDWLRVVMDRDNPEKNWDRHNVWFSHDVARLVNRWVKVVGPERFTLIVSDESDRVLLPHTFEDLLGLPQDTLKSHPTRSNRGLSWAETELVRCVNESVAEHGWSRPERRRFVKQGVLKDMASRPAPAGPKSPPFPAWALDQLRELSERRVEQIQTSGVRIVGDPESMRLPDDVPVAAGPADAPGVSGDVAAAAVAAVIRVALAQGDESGDSAGDEDGD
ncbi:hypothetical protein [Nocardioides sp.]|uniref:hypothetical protein n=1 Tax=Nocardioides sp. TaxID=35761 RepID=UPI00356A6F28